MCFVWLIVARLLLGLCVCVASRVRVIFFAVGSWFLFVLFAARRCLSAACCLFSFPSGFWFCGLTGGVCVDWRCVCGLAVCVWTGGVCVDWRLAGSVCVCVDWLLAGSVCGWTGAWLAVCGLVLGWRRVWAGAWLAVRTAELQ